MFGKLETKCSEFRRTKVWRKSPAAYQEAQIKEKNTFRTFLRTNETYINFIFSTSVSPLICCASLTKLYFLFFPILMKVSTHCDTIYRAWTLFQEAVKVARLFKNRFSIHEVGHGQYRISFINLSWLNLCFWKIKKTKYYTFSTSWCYSFKNNVN